MSINHHPERIALAADPYRPAYHYLPPCKWMNDPNGTIYYLALRAYPKITTTSSSTTASWERPRIAFSRRVISTATRSCRSRFVEMTRRV
jgi:hypothetical protein